MFFSSELRLKYFISQRIASVLFLIIYFLSTIFFSSSLHFISTLFIIFKLGMPPFHSWLVRITFIRPLFQLWLIFFVQKFIPLQFLRNLNLVWMRIIIILILTSYKCFLLIKRLLRVRSLLLISAWVNTSWLIFSLIGGNPWLLFLFIYGWILLIIIKFLSFFLINKTSSIMFLSSVYKIIGTTLFLNLAGLPPFSGFFIKLFILKSVISENSIPAALILLFLSLTVLYSYISIFYYFVGSNVVNKIVIAKSLPIRISLNFICIVLFFPLILNILN